MSKPKEATPAPDPLSGGSGACSCGSSAWKGGRDSTRVSLAICPLRSPLLADNPCLPRTGLVPYLAFSFLISLVSIIFIGSTSSMTPKGTYQVPEAGGLRCSSGRALPTHEGRS